MNRCEDTDPDARDKTFRQEGRKVFKEVVPMAAAHIEEHLRTLSMAPTDVRRYWLHQANLGMNQLVLKKLVGLEAGSDVRRSSWTPTPTRPRPFDHRLPPSPAPT